MALRLSRGVRVWMAAALLTPAAMLTAADWPEWRGPARTGASAETGLPERWSPDGERIALISNQGGNTSLVVHDYVGGRETPVTATKRRSGPSNPGVKTLISTATRSGG